MNNKDILLDMIGETDEKLVPGLTTKRKKNNMIRWTALGGVCAAAIACAVILPNVGGDKNPIVAANSLSDSTDSTDNASSVGDTANSSDNGSSDKGSEVPSRMAGAKAKVLCSAEYPDMPKYPDSSKITDMNELGALIEEWQKAQEELHDQPEGYKDGFDTFFVNSAQTFLNNSSTENTVYSPLSLYMALGISAEITDGNSRQQILDVLDQSDIETLRSHSKSIWQANYMDDGMSKCILATSFWTNSNAEYNSDTVNRLSDNYYTSVFTGDPVTDDYNKLYQDWLNAQTDGLLGDQVSELKLDPDMLLTIASTVNYCGKWENTFMPEDTRQADFHAVGGDVQCDFMNAERVTGYAWGDHFSSISLPLENNGQMRLILPDENYTPYDLLSNEQVQKLMLSARDYQNSKAAIVTMSVPKFDVTSNIDLKDGLNELGIKDIFDAGSADFTPLADGAESIYISSAEQDTRVTIDEEGCKAVSMTIIGGKGGGAPDEHEEFILDRPFIFEIVSSTGLPLFVGVVNDPAQ